MQGKHFLNTSIISWLELILEVMFQLHLGFLCRNFINPCLTKQFSGTPFTKGGLPPLVHLKNRPPPQICDALPQNREQVTFWVE